MPTHSHIDDPVKNNVIRVQSVIRSKTLTSLDTTRTVVAESLVGLNQDVLQRLPKRSTLDDNIRTK